MSLSLLKTPNAEVAAADCVGATSWIGTGELDFPDYPTMEAMPTPRLLGFGVN